MFAQGAKAEEAKAAGADIVGMDDLAAMVKAGDMPFDRGIAAPTPCASWVRWARSWARVA